ncbi:Tether containing UBX domain for GLUT4 [Lachnellula suecica]|uniref:Tether containing UBX domain for GLUT4 n=1 Tax=Lachnellula suecica TaxID=602035 RepID=A0A8T9C039_9HELO|nr:Tether containing UBX domain for GLUT4 [Lachnellula suecica]
MSSHVVVIDTSFRRQTVKVTPGKYMTDVLDEACGKFNIKSSNYGLKHNNKPLDLSRTVRQTGLSSGAKLELVVASRSPSVVSVALQLPQSLAAGAPGGRLTDKIPSDTTLWRILRKFESTEGTNLNFTGRGVTNMNEGASGAGQIVYEMPILNVMGRELATFADLQKTVAQLGFNSGSCLIRLNFKKTDRPLQEAMVEIEQYFKEEPTEPESNGAETAPEPEVDSITEAIARIPSNEPDLPADVEIPSVEPPQDITMDREVVEEHLPAPITPSKRPAPEVTPEPKKEEAQVRGQRQPSISVYSPPSSDTPKAALIPHNESDFEPTIKQAKAFQEDLGNRTQNKKLLSYDETEKLEKEKADRLSKVKEIQVRVRFPDQSSVTFRELTAETTGANLYELVTKLLEAEDQEFRLVWNGKGVQTVPQNEKKLIRDLGFEGGVLVNFVWGDSVGDGPRKGPVLKSEHRQKMQPLPVPEVRAVEPKEAPGPSASDKGKEKENSGASGKPKALPKWMKQFAKK